jgi:hypothetical protein
VAYGQLYQIRQQACADLAKIRRPIPRSTFQRLFAVDLPSVEQVMKKLLTQPVSRTLRSAAAAITRYESARLSRSAVSVIPSNVSRSSQDCCIPSQANIGEHCSGMFVWMSSRARMRRFSFACGRQRRRPTTALTTTTASWGL